MANIVVDNLSNYNVSGSELFDDSESFLQELTEGELEEINGGTGVTASIVVSTIVVVYSIVKTIQATIEYTNRPPRQQ
jgi:lactobin A/cerein 7B family class IIb bacteriocin